MKILLFFFSLLCYSQTFAQTQDLISLAKGDFLGMNALFDEKGNLFGYISIYDYGKSGAKTKKFEYVIMDKNLNPFANKEFEGDITTGDYYGFINFDGRIILKPNSLDYTLVEKKDMFSPSSMLIDLKDNTIKKKVYYDFDHGKFNEILQHDTWKENWKEAKMERKEEGFNYKSHVTEIKEGGFFVSEYEDHGSYTKNNRMMRFDEEKNELWRYDYNAKGSKKEAQTINYLAQDEKYYYGLLRERTIIKNEDYYDLQHERTSKKDVHYLLVLDMKTGKEVHKEEIPDPEEVLDRIMYFPTYSYGLIDNDKVFDDKVVVVGRVVSGIFYKGVCRLLVDKKTFKTDLKILTYKQDFKPFVPKMKANGHVENAYELDPRDIFFLRDGSVGLLFEKYKAATQYTAQKTTDMVYVHTDSNFNITGVNLFEKETSRWQNSDYLFSQNLNNDNDLVFFYRDYQKDDETKERNWNLFINTYIKGKFKQEMVPISSKENFLIIPYVAKEGYILLHEYNKKAKYNQVRLERLNY